MFNFAQPRPRSIFRANAYWADSKPISRRAVRKAFTLLSLVIRSIHPAYSYHMPTRSQSTNTDNTHPISPLHSHQ
ncbi:hypothetical protein M405DRAFT_815325, partial [Rhizopogon salebrosus TDB-379]